MYKIHIPVVPKTSNKSIRFPNNIITAIEAANEASECTFTSFVVNAVKTALDNLEEEQNDNSSAQE